MPDFSDDYEALLAADELDAVEDAVDAEGIELEAPAPPPLGRSYAYDFSGGGFIIERGGPLGVSGIDGLRYWIEKALRTARGAHAIYSDNYGMDYPYEEIGEPMATANGAELRERIEEALIAHPHIEGISDFRVEHDDDALVTSFTVRLRGEEATALTISNLALAGV